jgi:drug/metabolite transporter (DMT)-like permease
MGAAAPRLSLLAFLTLLVTATMFGANHVAARLAFNNGLDVVTAVAVRSLCTALIVGLLVRSLRLPMQMSALQKRVMLGIGVLIAFQSVCLYSAVARLPVAMALLAFNTFPLWIAGWVWVLQGKRPSRAVMVAMPVILLGLMLTLNAWTLFAQVAAGAQSLSVSGLVFALLAACAFGLAMAITQSHVAAIDGRVRSFLTMGIVGVLALCAVAAQGGFHWPQATPGWWGLGLLTVLYGTAFTVMFVLLPKLGVVGNSPILNVEPVMSLGMAWVVLDQRMTLVQIAGSVLVVAAVMGLGLYKPAAGK